MPNAIPVTADNFIRAETDMYFEHSVERGGFGKFEHERELVPIDSQPCIRVNRDTIYSSAIFDLDASPVTITMPDAGSRYMSMEILTEDQYVSEVVFGGKHTYTREQIGTRYVMVAIRTFVNPNDPEDMRKAHALQDALTVEQKAKGRFELPAWDEGSRKEIRDALLILGATLPEMRGAFGTKSQVDPVHRLIGAAAAWGGNPESAAVYLNVVPPRNDGKTVYRLNVKDVPVDGFWSVIVYNKQGYIPKNDRDVYSFNNITAKKDADGSVTIQFGGDPAKAPNCIPIVAGWNYMVRLYRPRPEILSGGWKFPEAQPLQ